MEEGDRRPETGGRRGIWFGAVETFHEMSLVTFHEMSFVTFPETFPEILKNVSFRSA
jgi:hypothetical protein